MSHSALPVLESRPKAIHQRIESFGKRFGKAHLVLAYHAAFPLALTPDLLYCLWANFQRDLHNQVLDIPWVAVADLLLSSLWHEVGNELYEIDTAVRNVLLSRLKENESFGQQRIHELSDFLLAYVQPQLQSNDPDIRNLAQAQRWTALAYTRPNEAARELVSALSMAYQQDRADLIRIASVVKSLAEPLAEFQLLLAYARGMANFARGDMAGAIAEFDKVRKWESQGEIAGVSLSIPRQEELAPTQEELAPTQEELAPTQEELAPTQEELAPTQEELAPTQEELAPTQEELAPTQEELAPTQEELAPTQEELAPTQEELAPTQEELAPTQEELAPTQEELAPTQEELAPTQEELAPTQEELAPTQEELAPTQEELAPTQEELAPTQEELAPTQEELAPTQEELAPTQEELAPTQEELAPTQEELAPTQEELTTSSQQSQSDESTPASEPNQAEKGRNSRTRLLALGTFVLVSIGGLAWVLFPKNLFSPNLQTSSTVATSPPATPAESPIPSPSPASSPPATPAESPIPSPSPASSLPTTPAESPIPSPSPASSLPTTPAESPIPNSSPASSLPTTLAESPIPNSSPASSPPPTPVTLPTLSPPPPATGFDFSVPPSSSESATTGSTTALPAPTQQTNPSSQIFPSPTTPSPAPSSLDLPAPGSLSADSNTELIRGDRSQRVVDLQQRLRDLGYYSGRLDGIFSLEIEAAVREFQRDYGLPVDGVVGSETWAALQNPPPRTLPSPGWDSNLPPSSSQSPSTEPTTNFPSPDFNLPPSSSQSPSTEPNTNFPSPDFNLPPSSSQSPSTEPNTSPMPSLESPIPEADQRYP
jgi:peptidoglycan hydrolase CwlO-like protein